MGFSRGPKAIFERMVQVVRHVDPAEVEHYRMERDYEGLELYIIER